MPSYDQQTIFLVRDNPSCPWGFRIQGGVDLRLPLIVQRVSTSINSCKIFASNCLLSVICLLYLVKLFNIFLILLNLYVKNVMELIVRDK